MDRRRRRCCGNVRSTRAARTSGSASRRCCIDAGVDLQQALAGDVLLGRVCTCASTLAVGPGHRRPCTPSKIDECASAQYPPAAPATPTRPPAATSRRVPASLAQRPPAQHEHRVDVRPQACIPPVRRRPVRSSLSAAASDDRPEHLHLVLELHPVALARRAGGPPPSARSRPPSVAPPDVLDEVGVHGRDARAADREALQAARLEQSGRRVRSGQGSSRRCRTCAPSPAGPPRAGAAAFRRPVARIALGVGRPQPQHGAAATTSPAATFECR